MWTRDDIPDLAGKTIIVTGGNSGLGFETSRAIAARGANVIMACRSIEKGEAAAHQIRGETPEATLEVMTLDLADLSSVLRFTEEFIKRGTSLDILFNNSGVMALPERKETKDGFEMQFGTNHLGHFALTGLLMDLIQSSPHARVVTTSSNGHKMGKVEFDNLNAERSYGRWGAYGLSKLSNLLFTYELQRRMERAGNNVIAVAAHPGYAATNLQRHTAIFRFLNHIMAQNPAMGALPQLYAATAPDVHGGDYIGPDGFWEQRGYPLKVQSNELSHDKELAERLWEVSEKLTGVQYVFEGQE
ncbi:MAG: oxidoreductase [Nitrososphaerales archaeon]